MRSLPYYKERKSCTNQMKNYFSDGMNIFVYPGKYYFFFNTEWCKTLMNVVIS